MNDKQIIIDGVDVSGCVPYKNKSCLVDFCLTDMPFSEAKCEKNPNCYYKQLKRKEQECERLKEGLNLILTVQKNCKLCPHQKLDIDVLVCDLDCATAFKKIAKQTLQKCEK